MNIEIGKFAGFCDGVKYAVENTFSQAAKDDNEIYVDGHLIHNPQTLEMLDKSGVKTYEPDEDMSVLDGKTVIIRAHGISPERKEKLSKHAKKLVNLTCKYVARIQSVVKKHSALGYRVIVIGNPVHPEIVGVCGYANEDVHVVYKEEDILKLPEQSKKAIIVAQTTLQEKVFNNLVDKIKNKYENEEIIVKNTICEATEQRQTEILDIAKRNDVVLVIGGSESSNTKNLYKIASTIKPTHYVEFKEDLEKIDLSNYKNIGIMAGASTPDWVIEEIAQIIKDKYSNKISKFVANICDFFNYSYISFSIGVFLMSYSIFNILSIPFNYKIGMIASFYYLFLSLGNGYSNHTIKVSDKKRYIFYEKNKILFTTLIVLSSVATIFLSYKINTNVLMINIIATLLGIIYNSSFNENSAIKTSFFYKLFKKAIPLKSIIIPIAIITIINTSIYYTNKSEVLESIPQFIFSTVLMITILFIRQALIEIRFSQSDKIAGAKTLTSYIEADKLLKITTIIPIVLFIITILLTITKVLQINIKYSLLFLYASIITIISMKRNIMVNRHIFSALVDSTLYVSFIISILL